MLSLVSRQVSRTLGPKRPRLILLSLACALFLPSVLCAAGFTASLDRDTVTLGETVTLSLAFTDVTPKEVPTPPGVPNLQIAYVGESSQFNFNNGQSSSTVSYNFQVSARQAGEYSIPAITTEVGGQKLTSQPLRLKVLAPNAPSQAAVNSGSQVAFLKLVLPRKEVYVGETIIGQLQFYILSRMQGASQLQLTGFPAEGVNVGKMVESQHRQTQIGNSVYTIIPVSVPFKVFKTGTLTIGPATFNLVINQRDPFDPFGMLGRGRAQQMALVAEPVTLQSSPLPRENVPANFNGAIGTYTMACSVGPTNVAVGDPITVKIQLSGRGSLESLSLPEQPAWHDFKTYPPTSKVETADEFGLQGTKTFEQVVTPQSADVKTLPGISFSFFDPEKKAYQTLVYPPTPLVVRPAGSVPTPTILASARGETPPPTQDIVPNKQRLGTLGHIQPPLVQQPWFLALQTVPLLGFVSAVFWRRRAEQFARNPRLRRQRQVALLIREGLNELNALVTQNDSEKFFATLFRLLQEQLGERLDLPATAITEAVIDERLRPLGVEPKTLTALQELFHTCNLARYAPIKDRQELAALIPKLEAVLQSLRELKL